MGKRGTMTQEKKSLVETKSKDFGKDEITFNQHTQTHTHTPQSYSIHEFKERWQMVVILMPFVISATQYQHYVCKNVRVNNIIKL